MKCTPDNPPRYLILDVDGVLTDGSYYYTEEKKLMKRFGPDDHDAIVLMRPYLKVSAVSGDKRGFEITRRRVETDMKLRLDLVSTMRRREWLEANFPLEQVAYMGDGIFDPLVFSAVGYAIAPANADAGAMASADYVTKRAGGDRAVAEACVHLLNKFFGPFDLSAIDVRAFEAPST